MIRDLQSRSDISEDSTREYRKRSNHRIIIIIEGVLKGIAHITNY